jgi:ABC-type multidrug transport system fused ATPase/permease subunit
VGIVGRTGSGKSSVIKLIERLYEYQAGGLRVFGQDVRAVNTKALRRSIAVVKQDPILFNGSILDNVVYGNEHLSRDNLSWALSLSGCDEFISSMEEGLETEVGERGNKLSGGQKQRVTIARALLGKPALLIFDEATASLDSKN